MNKCVNVNINQRGCEAASYRLCQAYCAMTVHLYMLTSRPSLPYTNNQNEMVVINCRKKKKKKMRTKAKTFALQSVRFISKFHERVEMCFHAMPHHTITGHTNEHPSNRCSREPVQPNRQDKTAKHFLRTFILSQQAIDSSQLQPKATQLNMAGPLLEPQLAG